MLGHRDRFEASEERNRCPVRLRLTASQPHQVSSVWYAQQLPVLQGFETRFTFQITDQSRRCFEVKDQNFGLREYRSCAVHGGDGFAFVLHSHENRTTTLGGPSSSMGFTGLKNSLAIEFDSWFNDDSTGEDVFYDHVAIYSRGQSSNSDTERARISAAAVHDLADGKVHVVKIRYYPELKVFVGYEVNECQLLTMFVIRSTSTCHTSPLQQTCRNLSRTSQKVEGWGRYWCSWTTASQTTNPSWLFRLTWQQR
ncbi:hypothetical protein DVH05_010486 [Phytophthora capsici]|nr:hypothetical protein DVH05_010486 [Phytophthora capsici]